MFVGVLIFIVFGIIEMVFANHLCALEKSIDITNGKKFLNGSIYHEGTLYPSHVTFVQEYANDGLRTRGCPCLIKQCVRKCCPKGMLYASQDVKNCTQGNEIFKYDVHSDDKKLNVSVEDQFHVLIDDTCENAAFMVDPANEPDDFFYVMKNGNIYFPNLSSDQMYKWENYCLENVLTENGTLPSALICFENTSKEESHIYLLYAIGMIVSIPFLLITFIVYGIVPELRNLHGKVLMGYVSSLLIAYISLVTTQAMAMSSEVIGNSSCIILAFLIYFFFMLSFFWLNVMCVDIWLAFRVMKTQRTRRTTENRRFIFYVLYSWSFSVLLTSFCAIIDFHPEINSDMVKPEFGKRMCWFATKTANFYYFYIPVIILIAVNITFFLLTLFKILIIKKETAVIRTGENNRRSQFEKEKHRFNLYLKLFLVMGLNWCAEWVSFVMDQYTNSYFWIVTDFCNSIQGIVIFLIFVCNKKVKTLIIKRYRVIRYGSTVSKSRSSSRFRSGNMSTTGNTFSMSDSQTEKSFLSIDDQTIKMSEIKRK